MQKKASITRGHTSSIKGRVFELILRELLLKAGFNFDFDTDQLTRNRKRLHGRGGTYDPDILGVFRIGIPFINPIMLIGEAKYYNGQVNISEARTFLGCFVDISQFPKVDTKSGGRRRYAILFRRRYNYCPIFFSLTGFHQSAEALMFAHGINFISYKNAGIMQKLYELVTAFIGAIDFPNFIQEDYKFFVNLSLINKSRREIKKDNFQIAYDNLIDYIQRIDSAIGVLDGQFPIHLLYEKKVRASLKRDVRIKIKGENTYELTNTGGRKYGEFTLPQATFLKEYGLSSKEEGKQNEIFKQIDLVTKIDNTWAIKQLLVTKESRDDLIKHFSLEDGAELTKGGEKNGENK